VFIGHFALGFAARRVVPDAPLWLLFLAAQLADVLWPFLLAAGVEHVVVRPEDNPLLRLDFIAYPYSHSLLLLTVWGVALGGLSRVALGNRSSFIVAALAVSHWLLDWVTHRPDMPLYPGGPTSGLGLWNSVSATLAVEISLFAAGVWLYAQTARARPTWRRARVWTLAGFLVIGYVGSLMGPPPPSVTAVYSSAIVLFAVVLVWSWWAEKK
jgi:hypothetical protein